MKKTFVLALLALFSCGLASCGNSSSSTNTEQTGPQVDEKLTIAISGTAKVGETITFVASYNGSAISPQSSVSYTAKNADSMDITGNKAVLKVAGEQTVTASYQLNGSAITNDFKFTVEEGAKVSTIAEAKAIAENNKYTPVLVRGVVQATSGTSCFIADATDGIYVYNWYFATTDTASVKNYSWVVGMNVEVYAYVTAYYDAPQLCGSYKDTTTNAYVDLEGKYAIKYEGEINAIQPQTITESDLAS